MHHNIKGALLALLAFAVYATNDVIVKFLGGDYSPVQTIFFSTLFSFPLAVLMIMRDQAPGTLRPVHPGWMAARTVATLITGVTAFYAFSVLPLAQTYTILFASPLLITLLAIPILGERIHVRRAIAIVIGLILLVLPLVPGIGVSIRGARIWVALGPISFQPGEFAKIALAIFFAAYLAERRELIAAMTWKVGPFHLPEPRYILPIIVAWGFAVIVMVGERDLGSSLLFFTLFVVMMWVATENAGYLVVGAVLFGGAAYYSWSNFTHVQTRVTNWIDPWDDPLDKGYQIIQSLYGLADGGLVGTGLGRGNPNQVPEAQNDFIFASIGEEFGLIGATAVLMSFVLIVGAGLRTAVRTDRTFEKLLATGLTAILGIQAFIIIGGVLKVIPLTGITLPFVSYGGSSLIANYILLALLIRVSDSAARRLNELPDDPTTSERWQAWRLSRRIRKAIKRGEVPSDFVEVVA